MCSNHRNHSSGPRDHKMERLKFYNHLRIYLVVNGLLLFFALKNGGDFNFYWVTFFWGIGLLSHYSKVFGKGLCGQSTDRYSDWEDVDLKEPFEEKKEKPNYKDRDLV